MIPQQMPRNASAKRFHHWESGFELFRRPKRPSCALQREHEGLQHSPGRKQKQLTTLTQDPSQKCPHAGRLCWNTFLSKTAPNFSRWLQNRADAPSHCSVTHALTLRGGPLRYVYAWGREVTWYKYLLRLRPISRNQRASGTPLDSGRPSESAEFDLAQGRGPHPGPSATIWADAVCQYRGHPCHSSMGRFASVPGLADRYLPSAMHLAASPIGSRRPVGP